VIKSDEFSTARPILRLLWLCGLQALFNFSYGLGYAHFSRPPAHFEKLMLETLARARGLAIH
jgi:hypothetical protein